MADNAERAERIKMKWLQRFARDACAQIAGERARFANCKLRSRRTRLACLRIRHHSAIAQRPKSRATAHRERVFDEHGAAFVAFDCQFF